MSNNPGQPTSGRHVPPNYSQASGPSSPVRSPARTVSRSPPSPTVPRRTDHRTTVRSTPRWTMGSRAVTTVSQIMVSRGRWSILCSSIPRCCPNTPMVPVPNSSGRPRTPNGPRHCGATSVPSSSGSCRSSCTWSRRTNHRTSVSIPGRVSTR